MESEGLHISAPTVNAASCTLILVSASILLLSFCGCATHTRPNKTPFNGNISIVPIPGNPLEVCLAKNPAKTAFVFSPFGGGLAGGVLYEMREHDRVREYKRNVIECLNTNFASVRLEVLLADECAALLKAGGKTNTTVQPTADPPFVRRGAGSSDRAFAVSELPQKDISVLDQHVRHWLISSNQENPSQRVPDIELSVMPVRVVLISPRKVKVRVAMRLTDPTKKRILFSQIAESTQPVKAGVLNNAPGFLDDIRLAIRASGAECLARLKLM